MGSVYEKVVDTSHNPPSTANQRQHRQSEANEPDYFEKTGLEPIFTKVDSELAHSDEEFRTKSSQLSNVEKTSEAGKLGISTYGMADTLNEGEREKDHVKENMGDSQKNKNVDAD
ncbi:19392_t:CDS:2 [Funneliformis geosporum]|uniref:1857_t:CDS:1 n=1 Tax=Funneliformis geosporum TaxID=1117311 RepID=A0A9W4SB50_9GLOM|nr:19392_t:CDS:2 [Funneliformis geosporum]CAI2162485.1 1857_t:CDS:2 [Funneliformis geosporum]